MEWTLVRGGGGTARSRALPLHSTAPGMALVWFLNTVPAENREGSLCLAQGRPAHPSGPELPHLVGRVGVRHKAFGHPKVSTTCPIFFWAPYTMPMSGQDQVSLILL